MFKKVILTLAVVVSATGSFVPYSPKCAVQKIEKEVAYTLANFGHILYGRSIVGEIVIPSDIQFCNSSNMQTFHGSGDDIKRFVLIKRGNCKFTKKILNAQKRGADMVIIYDNEATSGPYVVMANDGHGHLVDIPSIFISHTDGLAIIKTFQECNNSTIFKMTFETFKSEKVNLTFWLDSSNRESFVTIKDFFRDYYGVISKQIVIDTRFKINENCGRDACDSEDCILEKKEYCFPEKKLPGDQKIEGKYITAEHLREYFLFHEMRDKETLYLWVQYMNIFDSELCMEKLDVKECSDKAMTAAKVDKKTIDLISGKVNSAILNVKRQSAESNPLVKFTEEIYKHDILFFPEASINSRNFYGLFRAPDIFEMVCESLIEPPKQCHSFIKNDRKQTFGPDDTEGLWVTILQILIFFVLTFLIALLIYTRLIKKEMDQQMSVEVNKMVEHYVAMSDKSNASGVM